MAINISLFVTTFNFYFFFLTTVPMQTKYFSLVERTASGREDVCKKRAILPSVGIPSGSNFLTQLLQTLRRSATSAVQYFNTQSSNNLYWEMCVLSHWNMCKSRRLVNRWHSVFLCPPCHKWALSWSGRVLCEPIEQESIRVRRNLGR